MFLSDLSVRRPVATAMFFLGVVILGVISLTRLSVDLLPDISYPRLTIRTSYSDIPPGEVEELVTVPIEEALSAIVRVRRLESVSKEGVSLVTLEFLWGSNMDIAALNVREKLDNLRWVLPQEAGRPTILRLDPRSLPIMMLAVTGGDLVPLKEFSRNVIKRRLEQIQGVALAAVTGGFEREIQVEVDSRKLTALGLSIEQIHTALDRANRSLPGGTIRKGRYRYALRTLGEFQTVAEIEQVVLPRNGNGAVIPLKDVARVVDGFKERESITRFNGQEAIGVIITKEAEANTVAVSKLVREVLGQLREEYPAVQISVVTDQADFISEAIANVLQAVLLGGVLAFLVLFFFLHDVRNPIYIGVAIPLAILAAFALMFFTDISLNMISLGGLALGVGMLVDNSIVVLENIFRHRLEGADTITAAVRGAREVAMPVTASTLTTIAVFFPIIYVQGVAGQLFQDQSLTVTYSLVASLLVALTLLPMLAARVLRRKGAAQETDAGNVPQTRIYAALFESRPSRTLISRSAGQVSAPFKFVGRHLLKFWAWLTKWLGTLAGYWANGISTRASQITRPLFHGFDSGFAFFADKYEKLLAWSLDHRVNILAITFVGLLLAGLLGLTLDRQLMPRVDQGEFTLEVKLPPGSSLDATSQVVGRIEKTLLNQAEVAAVFARIGLASDQTGELLQESDLNRAQVEVRLEPRRHRSTENVLRQLRPFFDDLGEVEISPRPGGAVLSQFLGAQQPDIAVKINGNDLDLSARLAARILERLQDVPGLVDLHSSFERGRPEIRLSIDRESVGRQGLTARQVAEFVKDRMHGRLSTQFKDFDRKIDIFIRPELEERDELADLLNAQIFINDKPAPLRQFIRAEVSQGPAEIRRENQVRQVVLNANVQGRGFRETVQGIEARISKVEFPPDYQIIVGGQREEMQRSFASLLLAFTLAGALVYMILAAQFESLLHPFVIAFAVPLAGIGVVLALFLTGQSFNIMSLIGVVVLVGIVVNDAIIKVDFINQERGRGAKLRPAIMEAGRKRLRPIIMTTVTTVLGLLPMALGFGEGAELRRPLAIAVIGGLLSATFLTLIVVPVFYSLVSGERG